MTIELPTTGILTCDNCGDSTEVDLTEFAGSPDSVGFDLDDLPEGWEEDDDEHFCPICTGNEEED